MIHIIRLLVQLIILYHNKPLLVVVYYAGLSLPFLKIMPCAWSNDTFQNVLVAPLTIECCCSVPHGSIH